MFLHFQQEHFFHAFILLIILYDNLTDYFWSLDIPTKFLYMDRKTKNVFAYLHLINLMLWTHGNDQLRCIITLEHFMIWKYPWNPTG